MRTLCFLAALVITASTATAQVPSSDARWDGRFGAPGVRGTVTVAEAVPDGGTDDVYVGGQFSVAGTARVHNVARWDSDAQVWDDLEGGLQSLYNEYFAVHSLVVLDGGLWVAGYFRASLGTGGTAEHLARFDLATRTWSAPVASLDAGGNGIHAVTDGTALFLATGDGVQRVDPRTGALSTLTSTRATTLASEPGSLYIGGFFYAVEGVEAQRVARLDLATGTWHALGSGVNTAPSALHAAGGALYAGDVTEAGGVDVAHLARWDGTAWSGVGGGIHSPSMSPNVQDIDTAPNGTLYVTGQFSAAGGPADSNAAFPGVPATNAAWFDGTAWHSMKVGNRGGGTLPTVSVTSDGAAVFVGGSTVEGAALAVGIARWSVADAAWSALLDGPALGVPYRSVQTLTEAPDGALYGVAADWVGQTELPGPSSQVVRWTGAGWVAVGDLTPFVPTERYDRNGHDSHGLAINALVFGEDGTLYAAGQRLHTYAGYSGVYQYAHSPVVLRWNGTDWARLDGALNYRQYGSQYGSTAEITALALAGDVLYVAGSFLGISDQDSAPIEGTGGVLAYDTQTGAWSAVGGGIEVNGVDRMVKDLALDPRTGDLFAAGSFELAGGNSVRAIARYDGTRWHGLRGGGLVADEYGTEVTALVQGLAVTDGALYAVGNFVGTGGTTTLRGVARLSLGDETWSALGDGLSMSNGSTGHPQAVLVRGQTVFVGGDFHQAGGQPARNVAVWDGSAWGPLGSGVRTIDDTYGAQGAATSLALYDGALFVGGDFDLAGERVSLGIAAYEVGPLAGAEEGYLAWANYGVILAMLGFPPLEVYVDGAASPAAVLEFISFDDLGSGVITFPANRPFDVRFRFRDATPERWDVPQDTTVTVPAIAPGYYAGNTAGIPPGARHEYAPNPEGFPLDPSLIWSRLKQATQPAARRATGVDVAVLHTSTDAPRVDVTVAESGAVLADDLGYGQGSDAVTLPAAVHRVDVRRADTGALLESVVYDLTGAAGTSLAISVGGFLDPAANQNGPGLFVRARDEAGAPTAGEVVTAAAPVRPDASRLLGVGPNPTAHLTTLRYTLAEAADVRLDVFDALGRRVAVVAAGHQAAGSQAATVDAHRLGLADGVYRVRLTAGGWRATASVTVVR